MFPDGFQYFLDHFWNFKSAYQIWAFSALLVYRNVSYKTRKLCKHHLKYQFSLSQHFGNPKVPKLLALPDIKRWNSFSYFCFKYGGSKTIGFSERFQRTLRWWNLERNWKSEISKNLITQINPTKSNRRLKKCRYLLTNFGSAWNLCILANQVFESKAIGFSEGFQRTVLW